MLCTVAGVFGTLVSGYTWKPETAVHDAMSMFQAFKREKIGTVKELLDVLVHCGKVERKPVDILGYILERRSTTINRLFNRFADYVQGQCAINEIFGRQVLLEWTKEARFLKNSLSRYRPEHPKEAKFGAYLFDLCRVHYLYTEDWHPLTSALLDVCLLGDLSDLPLIEARCPELSDKLKKESIQFRNHLYIAWATDSILFDANEPLWIPRVLARSTL